MREGSYAKTVEELDDYELVPILNTIFRDSNTRFSAEKTKRVAAYFDGKRRPLLESASEKGHVPGCSAIHIGNASKPEGNDAGGSSSLVELEIQRALKQRATHQS